jgi:predicted RNA binding protein YcfA (HicA-like mRNA interferase family)
MSQIEKLMKKFVQSPQSVRYADIEKVLLAHQFEKIPTKGGHVKWKHHRLHHDLIIPVHNNDCKKFYKEQVAKEIRSLIMK